MANVQKIGFGSKPMSKGRVYPYEVMICLDNDDCPIGLNEGVGYVSCGGSFKLQELTEEKWSEHLSICECEWLIELAKEEQRRGVTFSALEILGHWKNLET